MSTILESIARERRLLDYPLIQKPSVHQLYDATVLNVQNLYNKLSNTGEAWSFGEHIITANGGDDTFSLAALGDKFGKPLVLTTYSADASSIERAVPFFDIQNLNFDWFMPRSVLGFNWFDQTPIETRVSFFYDNGGTPRLRFVPTPPASMQFRLKYTLGNWADKIALNNSPVLSQFHHLFEIRSAKDSLYMAEWEGLTREENREKRREIERSLDQQELRVIPDFDKHIREMTHGGLIFRKAWND